MKKLQTIINTCSTLIDVVCGDPSEILISRISSWSEASLNTISWINKSIPNRQAIAESLLSKVIVCSTDIDYTPVMKETGKVLLKSRQPRLLIIAIGTIFKKKEKSNISSSAIIHENSYIGDGCVIGNNCIIGECRIGKNTIIRDGTIVCDGVTIGDNCEINYMSVLGCSCSGIERDQNYKLVTFPHFSTLSIGNNVNIGAQVTIVKGVLTPTMIGDGSTIDSHCIIGHNTNIGNDVYIASDSCINGSVKVGDGVTIFSKSTIHEWVSIGDYSVVGQASLVRTNIPPYEMWFGHPAKFAKKLTEKFLPFE